MLCDANYRRAQQDRSDDPEKLAEVFADLINAAIADIPADMRITMRSAVPVAAMRLRFDRGRQCADRG
jgi:hypothetical protein